MDFVGRSTAEEAGWALLGFVWRRLLHFFCRRQEHSHPAQRRFSSNTELHARPPFRRVRVSLPISWLIYSCNKCSDQDGAEPSGNSIAVGNLERLSVLVDWPEYHESAARILRLFGDRLTKVPISLPEMVSGLMLHQDSPTEVCTTFIY